MKYYLYNKEPKKIEYHEKNAIDNSYDRDNRDQCNLLPSCYKK